MNWHRADCGESACLEAAKNRDTGVVLLRNSTHPELAPKVFTDTEWEDILDAAAYTHRFGGVMVDWAYVGFEAHIGLDTSIDEFKAFCAGVDSSSFEYNELPFIDEG